MKFLLILLLAVPAASQVRVTFSQLDPALFKKLAGGQEPAFALYQVSVCHGGEQTRTVYPGAVYQIAQAAGIKTLGPAVAELAMQRRLERRHPWFIALKVLQHGAWVLALAVNATSDQLSPRLRVGLPLLSEAFGVAADRLKGEAPDFRPLRAALLTGPVVLAPGACEEKVVLAAPGGPEQVRGEAP